MIYCQLAIVFKRVACVLVFRLFLIQNIRMDTTHLIATLVWVTLSGVSAKVIQDITEDLEVTVSRGAHISPLQNVLLYTRMEHIIFTLPDLPEPPAFSLANCTLADDESCELFQGLQNGVRDVSDLLKLVNRILTTKGLSSSEGMNIEIPSALVDEINNVNVPSNPLSPELRSKVGENWISETELALALRQMLINQTNGIKTRPKRWISKIILAGKTLAKHSGLDLGNIFKKLFVGDTSILSYLANVRFYSKNELKVFSELPKKLSELQVETQKLFLDVLNSTEVVKNIANNVEKEIENHAYKLATIEESFLLEQRTLADVVRSLFVSVVYSIHFAAFEECRSSNIPVAFVPPALLQERLLSLEKQLPPTLGFVIPLEEYERYYKMQLAECVYDSSGGIIKISVPLVEKNSDMQIYSFKALHFGFNEMTCAIETPSSYIVKDIRNNRIFSVTELDEEQCQPETKGLCRVPRATADDSNNFCVSSLLSGEPAAVVKEACALNCFPDKRSSVSQITDDIFIGVHLPSTDVRLDCPDVTLRLNQTVLYGAVRFQAVCDCLIYIGTDVFGKSRLRYCDQTQIPKIDLLLPVQMTTFSDLLPFSKDGWDNTVFSHAAEIFNSNFQPVARESSHDDVYVLPFGVSALTWNFIQSIVMGYLYYRINAITATILAIADNIDLVSAAKEHPCELPLEAYILLYAILSLCVSNLLPDIVRRVYAFYQTTYEENVRLEARRVIFGESH